MPDVSAMEISHPSSPFLVVLTLLVWMLEGFSHLSLQSAGVYISNIYDQVRKRNSTHSLASYTEYRGVLHASYH